MAHRITLEFEDGDTLRQALEYIGDSDAPVMLIAGSVEYDDKTVPLWDGWGTAIDDLVRGEA